MGNYVMLIKSNTSNQKKISEESWSNYINIKAYSQAKNIPRANEDHFIL